MKNVSNSILAEVYCSENFAEHRKSIVPRRQIESTMLKWMSRVRCLRVYQCMFEYLYRNKYISVEINGYLYLCIEGCMREWRHCIAWIDVIKEQSFLLATFRSILSIILNHNTIMYNKLAAAATGWFMGSTMISYKRKYIEVTRLVNVVVWREEVCNAFVVDDS